MTSQSDAAAAPRVANDAHPHLTGSAAAAVVIGAVLAWAARAGAVQLLVALAAAQVLLGFAWAAVLRPPGRTGGLVIGAGAAVTADVAASVWPHSGLAAMTAVFGLAVPAMFVHQLVRGAARVRVLASFGSIALLVLCEAALPALLQVRHEFTAVSVRGDAALAVVVAIAGALLAGCFADLAFPVLRFDAEVPRGLVGVLVAAVVGAALGHLVLRDGAEFAAGRGAFVGGAVGRVRRAAGGRRRVPRRRDAAPNGCLRAARAAGAGGAGAARADRADRPAAVPGDPELNDRSAR